MKKRVKWGLVAIVGAGLIGWGVYSQMPKPNEELAEADKVMANQNKGKSAKYQCYHCKATSVNRRNSDHRQPDTRRRSKPFVRDVRQNR